ncbi:hypothetical protein [Natrinema versiforme]|uniref:Uncharacterized protein n=1 Tax=Natrinema versiforme TaxID=88724 RepID=A0A4P8WKN1_9EURY|nr:hypothetical protein [Natrinema versiforme]QCS43904.1 hypothetical protein FEJ81_16690 [Natrinema versiforme]
MAQEDTTETPDTPSGDQPDSEDTESDDSNNEDSGDGEDDSENSSDEDSGDSESNLREENREIVENNDPDFRLPDGVDVYEHKVTNSETVFIVHNTGDDIAQVMAANDGSGSKRVEKDFELAPDEVTRVVLPSMDMIRTGASVSVYLSFDEREELDEGNITTYIVDRFAWAPNHAPDIPHPFFLVFMVVLVNTGVIIGLVKSKNRTTEWAARIDRMDLGSQVLRKVKYHLESSKEDGLEYYIETIAIRLKHYNIAIVIGIFSVWGFLYLFKIMSLAGPHTISPAIPYPSLDGFHLWTMFSFDILIPEWFENSTVYILYSSIVSLIFATTTLSYLLVKDRKVIDATNPKNGKGGLYALSQGRFESIDVILETEEGYREVDKSWLYQPIPGVDKFECKEYYMEANVAVVNWNGRVEKISPKEIRTWQGKIDKLMSELQLAKDKVSYIKLNYADDVKDTAEKISAAKTQALEDEGYEGLGKVRQALEDRLDEKVEGGFQSLEELGYDEIEEEHDGDDDEKYKPDFESVEEIIDEDGDTQ